MLSDQIVQTVVEDYFCKVVGMGHYLTFKEACDVIDSYNFMNKTKRQLKRTLEMIRDNKGIARTREKIYESIDNQGDTNAMIVFNKALRELDNLMINPVTIPESWNIKWIPNPMWAYKIRHDPSEEFLRKSCNALEHMHIKD